MVQWIHNDTGQYGIVHKREEMSGGLRVTAGGHGEDTKLDEATNTTSTAGREMHGPFWPASLARPCLLSAERSMCGARAPHTQEEKAELFPPQGSRVAGVQPLEGPPQLVGRVTEGTHHLNKRLPKRR